MPDLTRNSPRPPTVCIVTPTYLVSNPRVVKEADALHAAGFSVRVVFSQGNLEALRQQDSMFLQAKRWGWSALGWSSSKPGERWLYYTSLIRYHLAQRLPPFTWSLGKIAEYGEGRVFRELARRAAAAKADLYIGHYPAGLAAAACAASRWGAKLGFDAEDLHTEDQSLAHRDPRQAQRIQVIESRYLPRCVHVSAASELIVEELVRRYQIAKPLVIHNVFPWADREALDGQVKDRKGPALSLYWFSQVIGENRGIEDAIRAAGLLKGRTQLHLRGHITESVQQKFMALARAMGVEDSVWIHRRVPPTEILSRAAEHDVGLAVEQPDSMSRALTVTNKLFVYLLAGLAVAATDLPGQRYVMNACPAAGFLYTPGDYPALAGHLRQLMENPSRLQAAKQAALQAAKERWNWERESQALVEHIGRLLGTYS